MFKVGTRVHSWTVTGKPYQNAQYQRMYPVSCKCGYPAEKRESDLKSGVSKSCRYCANNKHRRNLKGKRFGMWTVLYMDTPDPDKGRSRWICRCGLCGLEVSVRATNLTYGTSTKCSECANALRSAKASQRI